MRRIAAAGAAFAVLASAACNRESGVGYVELKVFPAFSAPLYLNTDRIEAARGVSVLRQAAGRAKLQVERYGQMAVLCEFDIRKNRIVTVTVSAFGSGARCDVRA